MRFWHVARDLYNSSKSDTANNSLANVIFIEWAESTTAHGFLDLARAKTFIGKLIWIVLISLSLLIMSYQVYGVIKDFSSHEWASTIKEKPSDPAELPFPSIIVCNVNKLKWSKVQKYNMTLDMIKLLYFYQNERNNPFAKDTTVTGGSTEKIFNKWLKVHNFTTMTFFDEMAPKREDLIIDQACGSTLKCNITPIDTFEYGRCHKLETSHRQTIVGVNDGIHLLLDTQSWDYLPLIDNNFMNEGIMLQLQYDGKVELGQWIELFPGTHTSISMQAVETTIRLEEKFLNPFALLQSTPPCDISPKLSFSDPSQYSVATCTIECQVYTASNGSCIVYKSTEHYRICEFNELFQYTKDFMNMPAAERRRLNEYCTNICPKPCYSKYVETQLSMSRFPSGRQREKLDKWIAAKNVQSVSIDDIIMVEIFFKSLEIQVIERYEIMSLSNLVSSSGGLIGLWAGMSFLTVFQALAFCIKYCEARGKDIKQRMEKNKTKVVLNDR